MGSPASLSVDTLSKHLLVWFFECYEFLVYFGAERKQSLEL